MPEHEIRTVTTLTTKREEIERTIAGYERALAQARADLASIKAAIVVFERPSEPAGIRPYMSFAHLFRYAELSSLCFAASGPLSTPALAMKVADAKGFDTGDKVLLHSLTYSVVSSMRSMEKRRKVRRAAKGRYVTWALP